VTTSDWHERLRDHGLRTTVARAAVLDVVSETADHLSGEEIAHSVALREPAVHRATVFRTLERLVSAGIVAHVHLPHGATTYHLRRPAERMHLHLSCRTCGRVLDADAGLLDDVVDQLHEQYGFDLQPTHSALSGRCSSCPPHG
jgi:Fur family ferric uptake transcriptional regulator